MADVRLEPPLSYLLIAVPLLLIALVAGIAADWDWRGFIVPGIFVAAALWYMLRVRRD